MRQTILGALLAGACLMLVNCASTQKQKVVVAYSAAETALETFQTAEIALYNAKTVASLDEAKHKSVNELLSKSFDIQDKVGAGLLLWQTGQPAPSSVNDWVTQAERVVNEIAKIFPENDKVKIAQIVVPWIRALVDTVKLLGIRPPPVLTAAAEGRM